MTTIKPAKSGSKARMIARRDKRIRSQAAELTRLRADRARLMEAVRDAYSEAALRGSGQEPARSNAEQCESYGSLLRAVGEAT